MAGDIYELNIGPDELTDVPQWVRVQVTEEYLDQFYEPRVRLKAIGGGRTNVPRWETWPTILLYRLTFNSMLKTEQLVPCVSDCVGERA
jgi:hypothetical protein